MRKVRELVSGAGHIVRMLLQGQRDIAECVEQLNQIRERLNLICPFDFSSEREAPLERLLDTVLASDGRYADPLCLGRYHAQVYSQGGEDGVLAEIFRRVGTRDRVFIEIGVGDGRENNTRLLLEHGWTGIWVDSSPQAVAEANRSFGESIRTGRLRVISANVYIADVNQLLDSVGAPSCCDFLSVDIDFNTPHVWKALNRQARVACIEYNASLPPSLDLSVPYDPAWVWDRTNWFGASLKTMERIGAEKELVLVGCDLLGANAFFVAADEASGKFREPFTAEHNYEPPRYRLLSHIGHPPSGTERIWQNGI